MSSMLTLAGNAAPTGFYDYSIEQSLRFNDDDNAYLSRTPSTGNQKTWTFSCWVKRGKVSGTDAQILTAYTSASSTTNIIFQSGGAIQWYDYISGYRVHLVTNALYRDVGSWYHLLFQLDTSNATSGDRAKIYVNGERVTSFSTEVYPSLNADLKMNTAIEHRIGDTAQFAREFDGYMADVNFIDGQALDATSFGETKSGIWIPKDTSGLTFGTNGFRLEYADSAAIGDDTSGNTNDWTVNNLVASDVVLDSPTNNFAVWSPLTANSSAQFKEGNLEAAAADNRGVMASFNMPSGKWYWEVRKDANSTLIGIAPDTLGTEDVPNSSGENTVLYYFDGRVFQNGSNLGNYGSFTDGDIIGMTFDSSNREIKFYKNNSLAHTVTAAAGFTYAPAISAGSANAFVQGNFGQDSTFAGNTTAGGNTDENGYGDFKYAPPSGALSLCSANLPSGAIDTLADETPEDYFNTALYTGNGGTQSITGVNFQPSLTWIKSRSAAYDHVLIDAVRGVEKQIISNKTDVESQDAGKGLTSFDSDGFTVTLGTSTSYNNSSQTYVGWNWKANGSGVSNTDGSITSTVSVGATSQQNWFSIVGYTGDGTIASGSNVGHGLGVKPDAIIVKDRDASTNWNAWFNSFTGSQVIYPNLTNARNSDANVWSATEPTSSVFYVGNSAVNASSNNYIAYCFANAEGLCKVGSYTGNGNTGDGTFVYTGFRPSFVLFKRTDAVDNWVLEDNKRNPSNLNRNFLLADTNGAEGTVDLRDFLSNGFKMRGSAQNASGGNYIYLAIAEQPFKFANAR